MREQPKLKYQLAAQKLLERISTMQPGSKLPNRNVLASEMQIARSTLEHAIAELIAQGHLVSRDGSGTYVTGATSVGKVTVHDAERWLTLKDSGISPQPGTWAVLISSILYDIYPIILRSVQDVARAHDINLIVCNTDNETQIEEDFLYKLAKSGVSGVVIVPAINGSSNPLVFPALQECGIHFVSCFRPIPGFFTPGVYGNSFQAGYIGTRHLLEQGCEHVAFFSAPIYQGSYERYQGYLAALAEAGIATPLVSYETSYAYEKFGIPQAEALLDAHPEIDGIFAFNDRIARETYPALRKRGLQPGRDVLVLGCDNTSICDQLSPRLTSISFPLDQIGAAAGEMLWSICSGHEPPRALQVYGCTLTPRHSTQWRDIPTPTMP